MKEPEAIISLTKVFSESQEIESSVIDPADTINLDLTTMYFRLNEGNERAINFFNKFLAIPEGRSITELDQNQQKEYIIQLFLNDANDETLSLNALRVIDVIIGIYNNVPEFLQEELLEVYINLMAHPNKYFAIVATHLMQQIMTIRTDSNFLEFISNHGFWEKIFKVTDFNGFEPDPEEYNECVDIVSSLAYNLLTLEGYEDYIEQIIQYATTLISAGTETSIARGFGVLAKLLERKIKIEMDDFLYEKILSVAQFQGEPVNEVFYFISRFDDGGELIQHLQEDNFIDTIVSALEVDNPQTIFIFRFLNSQEIFPEPGSILYDKLFEFLNEGHFRERREAIDYLYSFITDAGHPIHLQVVEDGILNVVNELIDSTKEETLNQLLNITRICLGALSVDNIDPLEVPGGDELYDTIIELSDNTLPHFDFIIQTILHFYEQAAV